MQGAIHADLKSNLGLVIYRGSQADFNKLFFAADSLDRGSQKGSKTFGLLSRVFPVLNESNLVFYEIHIQVLGNLPPFLIFFLVCLNNQLSDFQSSTIGYLKLFNEPRHRFSILLEGYVPFLIGVVIRLEFN